MVKPVETDPRAGSRAADGEVRSEQGGTHQHSTKARGTLLSSETFDNDESLASVGESGVPLASRIRCRAAFKVLELCPSILN